MKLLVKEARLVCELQSVTKVVDTLVLNACFFSTILFVLHFSKSIIDASFRAFLAVNGTDLRSFRDEI